MNTMEITKIVAGFCAALLVFLSVRLFIADPIYFSSSDVEAAYVLEVSDTPTMTEEEEAIDYVQLVSAADVSNGEREFNKCKACHKLEPGANGVGPSLAGIVGRDVAGADGFSYSSAMGGVEGAWSVERIAEFLHQPKDFVPGTKMTFAGFRDAQDGADVAAYLASQ